METFQSFMDLNRMPNEHELVYVFALLQDTGGMLVADRFLEARKISVPGVACGPVPGHGGDLHFVRHDGGAEAVYLVTELCPLTSVLPKPTCGECGGGGYLCDCENGYEDQD